MVMSLTRTTDVLRTRNDGLAMENSASDRRRRFSSAQGAPFQRPRYNRHLFCQIMVAVLMT